MKIGRVELDLTKYPGQDFYCDGSVEQELLQAVKDNPDSEYEGIIRSRADWPTLYHLSSIRGNIVDWIPFEGTEKVLEIGAGPGAITGTLSAKCAHVDCVELSLTRSKINAQRHRSMDNITIHVGNFEDIEPDLPDDYDYIFLIGVLEYAGSYIHNEEDPFRAELSRINAHLKKDTGRLVIAIENRLGMKYFAGCREDHSGRYFDGIENYPKGSPATTFSRPALEKLLRASGTEKFSFYYPYPDYKFMSCLYSDRRLPQEGELTENIRNFDRDRLLLFDENKAYNAMIPDGLFGLFSNSFVVVTGDPLPVVYSKYSNDRAPQYRIRTQLRIENGEKKIVKSAADPEAQAHIDALLGAYEMLCSRYRGSSLKIAPCRMQGTDAVFDYIGGETLEKLIDTAAADKDWSTFEKLIARYRELVGYKDTTPAADYDMTFANIIVNGDQWTAIDYEWFRQEPVPAKEMTFRALWCYFRENPARMEEIFAQYTEEGLGALLGITAAEAEEYKQKETDFQDLVTGGNVSLGAFRVKLGAHVIIPGELQLENMPEVAEKIKAEETAQDPGLTAVQVYYDRGSGYSEQDSCLLPDKYGDEGMITITVDIPENCRKLRIDPALCPCVVLPGAAFVNGNETKLFAKYINSNGRKDDGLYVFATSDPNFEWDMAKIRRKAGISGSCTLQLTIQMAGIPSTMAHKLKER